MEVAMAHCLLLNVSSYFHVHCQTLILAVLSIQLASDILRTYWTWNYIWADWFMLPTHFCKGDIPNTSLNLEFLVSHWIFSGTTPPSTCSCRTICKFVHDMEIYTDFMQHQSANSYIMMQDSMLSRSAPWSLSDTIVSGNQIRMNLRELKLLMRRSVTSFLSCFVCDDTGKEVKKILAFFCNWYF